MDVETGRQRPLQLKRWLCEACPGLGDAFELHWTDAYGKDVMVSTLEWEHEQWEHFGEHPANLFIRFTGPAHQVLEIAPDMQERLVTVYGHTHGFDPNTMIERYTLDAVAVDSLPATAIEICADEQSSFFEVPTHSAFVRELKVLMDECGIPKRLRQHKVAGQMFWGTIRIIAQFRENEELVDDPDEVTGQTWYDDVRSEEVERAVQLLGARFGTL